MQNPDEIFVTGRFDIALFEPDLYSLLEIQKPDGIMGMAKKRQADHLAGRIFARLALSGLGAERIDLPIGSDRAPIWPNGVKGSLSHSHGHACCLATKNEALTCGVDLEKVASGSGLDAIRQKCLNSSERVWIRHQTDIAPDALATLLFSAKESIFKAYHGTVGRFFGFESAEVQDRTDTNILLFQITESLHPTLPKNYEVPVHFDIIGDVVLTWIIAPHPKLQT